jgi:hypothetical protein
MMHAITQDPKTSRPSAFSKPSKPSKERHGKLLALEVAPQSPASTGLSAAGQSLSVDAHAGSGHDFGRIPIHSAAHGIIQSAPKLESPGEELEREAGRIADEVMRMPDPRGMEVRSGAAGCPLPRNEPAQIPAFPPSGSADAEIAVPSVVDEVVSSPGRPLETDTRALMEPLFGHRFDRVRVHADSRAFDSANAVHSLAFTVGNHVVFGENQYRPSTLSGKRLLAHELAHVVQQRGGKHRLQREAAPGGENRTPETSRAAASPANPRRLEIEVVGADATVDEPLAVMADRWARDNGGQVIRATSIENMIGRLASLIAGNACLGQLNVWYHGGPEIQLVVGEYDFGPGRRRRIPRSGFSRQWLTLESNRTALARLRGLFCCNGLMRWFGCGTMMVRASGGLRTAAELASDPRSAAHPDVYRSAQDARAHGASLSGASFGSVNVQAWADGTCTTVRSATDFVEIYPERTPSVTIARGGSWTDTSPRGECACDPATGRVAGPPPSRETIVRGMTAQEEGIIGSGDILWHRYLSTLRTGIPRELEIVGPGGRTISMIEPGTLPARLQAEAAAPGPHVRGPLERQYTDVIRAMLHLAAEGITPPSPLAADPMPPIVYVRIRQPSYQWAAVTQPHLVVAWRDTFWHWIVFNDAAIGETREFTRTVIQHELEHAADYETSYRIYEAAHPRPSSALPAAYIRPAEESTVRGWNDEWGRYINGFIAFHEGRSRPERHFEIIVGQRRGFVTGGPPLWGSWSAQERVYWFEQAFNHLPPDVPAGTAIAGEADVIDAFNTADASLQDAALERAYGIVDASLRDPGSSGLRARARTLVEHFEIIVDRLIRAHPDLPPRPALIRALQPPSR